MKILRLRLIVSRPSRILRVDPYRLATVELMESRIMSFSVLRSDEAVFLHVYLVKNPDLEAWTQKKDISNMKRSQ